MKKKGVLLLTSILTIGLFLGTINVSAVQTNNNTLDIDQYEKKYKKSQIIQEDNIQPEAAPTFVSLHSGAFDAYDRIAVNGGIPIISQKPESFKYNNGFIDEFGR